MILRAKRALMRYEDLGNDPCDQSRHPNGHFLYSQVLLQCCGEFLTPSCSWACLCSPAFYIVITSRSVVRQIAPRRLLPTNFVTSLLTPDSPSIVIVLNLCFIHTYLCTVWEKTVFLATFDFKSCLDFFTNFPPSHR